MSFNCRYGTSPNFSAGSSCSLDTIHGASLFNARALGQRNLACRQNEFFTTCCLKFPQPSVQLQILQHTLFSMFSRAPRNFHTLHIPHSVGIARLETQNTSVHAFCNVSSLQSTEKIWCFYTTWSLGFGGGSGKSSDSCLLSLDLIEVSMISGASWKKQSRAKTITLQVK